jgi:ribosomal protein L29
MKISEIKKSLTNNLVDLLSKKKEEIRKIRFDINSNKNKNVKVINKNKKEIARIMTVLREKKK